MARKKPEASKANISDQNAQPETQQRELVLSGNPRPVWIDSVNVTRQMNRPILMMTFFSLIPETDNLHEVQRVVIANDHAQRVVDVLCQSLGYYPEKPID